MLCYTEREIFKRLDDQRIMKRFQAIKNRRIICLGLLVVISLSGMLKLVIHVTNFLIYYHLTMVFSTPCHLVHVNYSIDPNYFAYTLAYCIQH